MRSWTRTLNLDDAHIMLRLAVPGTTRRDWEISATSMLVDADRDKPLTEARLNDLLRIIRVSFLSWEGTGRDAVITENLFLRMYHSDHATPSFQEELVDIQWALYSEVARVAITNIIIPHLDVGDGEVDLATVDAFCHDTVDTDAPDSLRKTRTVLIKALERAGVMRTSGTGRYRRLWAQRGEPHPMTFAYLLLLGMEEKGQESISYQEAVSDNFGMFFTQCDVTHAFTCVSWALQNGILNIKDGSILR